MSETKQEDRWNVRPIVEVALNNTFMDGDWILTEDLSQSPNGVRLIQLGNIGKGDFIDDSRRWISEQTLERLGCTVVKAGDILVSRMADPIARACIVPDFPYPCITAVDCTIVRVDESRFDRRFVNYLFNSEVVRTQGLRFSTGTTRKRISRRNLERIMVAVPSLAEQQRISSILDRVTALRKMRQQAAELASKAIQSLFLKTFGDPKTNPMKWERVAFEELATIDRRGVAAGEIVKGTKYVGLEHIEKGTGEIAGFVWAMPGELKSNKFAFTSTHVLYGKLRPYLNKVALPEFAGVCSTDILPMLPKKGKATREYLAHLIKHPYFVTYATEKSTGANLPRISPREIERFEAPAPPYELQERFSAFVSSMRKLSVIQKESAQEINELFHSLMEKAFRGELRSAS